MDAQPRIDRDDELVCLGHAEDLAAQGGALAPPIVRTSLFAQPSLAELAAGLADERHHHVYTRGQNPTVEAVESKLAALERGAAAKAFGSGMAAVSAVLLGLLDAGDHVLFVNQTYGPTLALARRLARLGVEHDQILDLEPAEIESALRPQTRLLWIESPGTMTFRVLDVAAVARLARSRGILTALDNSWATPLFQKPLAAGIDLVVHSATKYLGGHSDLVAGAVVGSAELIDKIFYDAYLLQGGILAPGEAWLLNRGLRTLPARMRHHHAAGIEIAGYLARHRAVRRVFHPALDETRRELVETQLGGCSGLFAFELASDRFADLGRFVDALDRFRIGVSWGGVESLVITPGRGDNRAALERAGIPASTVRLSVGLEPVDVLIADLERALAGLER